jgi:hypothetical protein
MYHYMFKVIINDVLCGFVLFTAGYWSSFRDYIHIASYAKAKEDGLLLESGMSYRIKVKFCAGQMCYPPLYSDGVTVTANAPVTGSMLVQYTENHITNTSQVTV